VRLPSFLPPVLDMFCSDGGARVPQMHYREDRAADTTPRLVCRH